MPEDSYPLRTILGYYASRPGIQIGTGMSSALPEDDARFARQLGVEWVMTGVGEADEHSAANYRKVRERFERAGLKVYRLGHPGCHNMPDITLNLPGRDAKLEEYLTYIRNLGAAGIHYSTYAHMANSVWGTDTETIRGGAVSRAFHLEQVRAGGEPWGALTHGRVYSDDELWDNYIYFIRRVVPVAEESGVYIGIHPDDPPLYPLGGVPRPIFGTFEGYKRAIEIADSSNIGVCLCVGCWLEGGKAMGKDVVDTIRYFGGMGKLFKVHLRNITAPMPEGFAETFLDDGYQDMWQVIRALQDIGYDGAVISDHLPQMVGGHKVAEAHAVGYMRGLIQAVENESRAGKDLRSGR